MSIPLGGGRADYQLLRAGGEQYLSVVVARPATSRTANLPVPQASRVLAYKVGAKLAVINGTDGQIARAVSKNAAAGEAAESVGTAPYTAEQVTAGPRSMRSAARYARRADGSVAAPALAGPAFARSKPSLLQLHTIVTRRCR